MWTKCLPRDTIQPMESTLRNSNEIICKHRKIPLQVPGKVYGESGRSVKSRFEVMARIEITLSCVIIGFSLNELLQHVVTFNTYKI